jgi:uracil-DNA glycosylase
LFPLTRERLDQRVKLPHPLTGVPFESPVPPGTGWPDDLAGTDTPVATTAAEVRRLATRDKFSARQAAGWSTSRALADVPLTELDARASVCRACPRLVEWREEVAASKRASYADQPYWGRPVAGWGETEPRVLIVGLAPAANGGNRTGRIFTGDSSGDWLFASLHRVGLATRPTSTHAGDGQRLIGARMAAAVRCAPPANKPTTAERDTCAPWFHEELRLVAPGLRAIVALGGFAWNATVRAAAACEYAVPAPKPKFGHGLEVALAGPEGDLVLLGCYHPSQQNTFTRRLTAEMLDDVLGRAARR